MKGRGKALEVSINGSDNFNYSSSSSDLPCKKHPSSSNSAGICAYCLKDRLIKLVCSDCGEQRLSSCSCSDVSSYRNSCSTVEVGSVGRISFLIENEKTDTLVLKRSNSSCVEMKRNNGFWRIGRFFGKKRNNGVGVGVGVGVGGAGRVGEIWGCDYNNMGVSRSRSLCSFRGEGSEFAFSSAKISDVNEAEPRKSGFKVKESYFSGMDDSGFIDLKLDLSSESKPEMKMGDNPISVSEFGSLDHEECGGFLGGSCRITVNERGVKKGSKKGYKVWRWIFRHHTGWRDASDEKDGNHISKP